MRKAFIGWGFTAADPDEVVNCGEHASPELAAASVADQGMELAEVETVYRSESQTVTRTVDEVKEQACAVAENYWHMISEGHWSLEHANDILREGRLTMTETAGLAMAIASFKPQGRRHA